MRAFLAGILLWTTLVSVAAGQEAQPPDVLVEISIQVREKRVGDVVSKAQLTATSFDKPSSELPPVVFQADEDGTGRVRLSPGRWGIEAQVEGYWSTRTQVVVAPGVESASVELWPAGIVEGLWVLQRGQKPPESMSVLFRPAPGARLEGKLNPATLLCPIEPEGRWQCQVPAGELDLRFVVSDFVPRFAWGLVVPRGKTVQVGRSRLVRGSVAQGWVTTVDGTTVKEGTVRLRPRTHRVTDRGNNERIRYRALTADINERGFFQIVGATPGAYLLEAEVEGYARATTTVQIAEGRVTEIAPPLVVTPPVDVDLYVTPPLDPWGKSWTVEVKARDDTSRIVRRIAAEAVPETGALTIRDVAPGLYTFRVVSQDGQGFWADRLEIDAHQGPIQVDLDYVDVEGEVLLGEDPLVSTLYFGGRHGAVRVELPTDEEGRYQGFLPRSGEWYVAIEAKKPPVNREVRVLVEPESDKPYAEVDVHLPDGRIHGQVVTEEWEPVAAGIVDLRSASDSLQTSSDRAGRFALRGLEPGPYYVTASGGQDFQSDTRFVEVVEGRDGPSVALVVRPVVWIHGMLASEGNPVVGGRIEGQSIRPVVAVRGQVAASDAQGLFALRTPAESQQVLLKVAAPGFAYRMLRVPTEERLVNIRLQTTGGALVLDFESPPSVPGYRPVIFNEHGFTSMFSLFQWARLSGGEIDGYPERTHYVFPMMEPGNYGICILPMASSGADLGDSWKTSNGCATGYLAPNGELTLKVPEATLKRM